MLTVLSMWKEYLTTTNNYLFTLVESSTESNTRQRARVILEASAHADKERIES